MMPIADRGLCHLRNQCLGVEQQQVLQRTPSIEFVLDHLGPDPIGVTAALDNRLVRRGLPAEEQGNAEQAFASCHRDFRRCTIRHDIDERDDAVRGEIEVWQLAARCVYDFTARHRNELEARQQSFVDCFRQGREKMILAGSRWRWHCGYSHECLKASYGVWVSFYAILPNPNYYKSRLVCALAHGTATAQVNTY